MYDEVRSCSAADQANLVARSKGASKTWKDEQGKRGWSLLRIHDVTLQGYLRVRERERERESGGGGISSARVLHLVKLSCCCCWAFD